MRFLQPLRTAHVTASASCEHAQRGHGHDDFTVTEGGTRQGDTRNRGQSSLVHIGVARAIAKGPSLPEVYLDVQPTTASSFGAQPAALLCMQFWSCSALHASVAVPSVGGNPFRLAASMPRP